MFMEEIFHYVSLPGVLQTDITWFLPTNTFAILPGDRTTPKNICLHF